MGVTDPLRYAGTVADTDRRLDLPVVVSTLRRERRGTVVWAVALAAVSGLYTGLFPTMQRDPALLQVKVDVMGSVGDAMGLKNLTSAGGYLDATVFGLLGPLLMIIFVTISASRAVAGDDEQGLLDLYLAQPVSRRRYLVERTVALVAQVAVLATAVGATVMAFDLALDIGVPASRLVVASLGLALLALGFGAVAILAGALVGRRAVAVGVTAAAAVLTYLAHGFAVEIAAVHGLRWISPFWWYLGHGPATVGLGWGPLLALLLLPVVLVAIAVPVFDRRDVGV